MTHSQEQIGDLIVSIYKEVKTRTEKSLKAYGIGMGQLHILMLYYGNPGKVFTQSEFVQLLNIDKGNVSRNMHKLLDKGYVAANSSDSGDATHFQLTAAGLEIKKDIMSSFIMLQQNMTDGISAEVLEQTVQALSTINKNLLNTRL